MALINQLNNLGDAVRERTGTTQLYTLDEMADTIRNIPSGGTSFYTGPGIYLSEDGELGVKTSSSIGTNENGELMTEAWWIPYADTNVGSKLDELQNRVEGIYLIDMLSGENMAWTDSVLNADYEVLHSDLYNNLLNDAVAEMAIECFIEGEGFGRGIRTTLVREETTDGVLYLNYFSDEGLEFSHIVINTTNNTVAIGVNSEDIIGQGINTLIIRFIEQTINVQRINTMDGIWKNEYNDGRVIDLGVDRSYIEAIVDEKIAQIPIAEEVSV